LWVLHFGVWFFFGLLSFLFSSLIPFAPCFSFIYLFIYWALDYGIGSNFWKFYLIRTGFTLGELVFLVKVFRLFRSGPILLVFRAWTQCITSYLLAGPACFWCLVSGGRLEGSKHNLKF
jgi:hypothetical protein